VRISTTTIESYRLWRQPDQEWMSEADLLASIRREFTPNRQVLLGLAFGRVLEEPDLYRMSGGYGGVFVSKPYDDGSPGLEFVRPPAGGKHPEFFFSLDTMAPAFDHVDRRGVFEAKAQKDYGDCQVVAKADHLLGSHLSEFKTTVNSFDPDKYALSCQWRFMADIFQPSVITYKVFLLSDDEAGIIGLRGVESMNLYPYAKLHEDCCELVEEFKSYVIRKGLDNLLRERMVAS
jgi:hypothetical protein